MSDDEEFPKNYYGELPKNAGLLWKVKQMNEFWNIYFGGSR